MRPNEVMSILNLILCVLCSVGLTRLDGAKAVESVSLSTAEAAAEYQRLSQNVTNRYFSNEEVNLFLYGLADTYSDFVSVFSIGESVLGAPLLAIDVGTSAGELDSKPRFLYVGNMHGNEPTGRQLCLAYALDLVTSTSAQAQNLRDRSHTIIIPTLNPDGYDLDTRENKDGVDLNRAFPDRSDAQSSQSMAIKGTEPPEVLAISGLATTMPMTGAASLHEGAVVAVIPWDGDASRQPGYSGAPDDDTFRFLAQTYANASTRMAAQKPRPGAPPNKEVFEGGVSNGNEWYPVYNGLQDWLYVATGCRAITLELSETKAPPATLLEEIWEENRAAMPALSAAATLAGLQLTLSGPGAASATARTGTGLPAYAHATPATTRRRHLSATPSRDLSNAALLRGAGNSGAAGVISEDDAAARNDGAGFDGDLGDDNGIIHLPLAPGVHNVSVEAPGAQPEVRVVEIPGDGSGAQVHIELAAPEQVAAARGQQVEQRTGHSTALAGGFPYTILRGRRANPVQHMDQAQVMTPDMRIGTGVQDAMIGLHQQGGAATGAAAGVQEQHGDVGVLNTQAGGQASGANDSAAQPGGDLAAIAEGLNEDQADNVVQLGTQETFVGDAAGDHAQAAGDAGEQGEAHTVNGVVESGVGGGVAVVLQDKPHSAWWRSLRGAIAAAGAAFIALQIMRLKGRPVLGGWGEAGGRGARGRRGGQAVSHGHHSFHQRPGMV